MKIKFLAALFFSFILLSLNAQTNSLRNVVAVVRPVYSETTIDFLTKFSESLKSEGYETASSRIKSYTKGGFGSGFVYTNPQNGQNYVLTNRHVVVQAQSVNIEFMMEDQSVRAFNKCKIVAMDDDHDLALIALPIEAKFEKTVDISPTRPDDGVDVFTVGYPGLGSEPSWQFGKGIVSNSNLKIDEIMIGNVGVIQHTAQVDPGSSGGPLLVRNSNSSRGYDVVGINTWKAQGRDNVNISIPSSVIIKFISDFLSTSNNYTKEKLEQRVKEFSNVTNDGFLKILPFISYDYIAHLTINSYLELFHATSDKVKEAVVKQFDNGYPIEGVRIVIADAIGKKLNSKKVSFSSIEGFSETEPTIVNVNLADKNEKTEWVAQQGHWQITNIPSLKIESEWKKGLSGDYGYGNSFFVYSGSGFGVNSSSFEITYQGTIRTYYTYGASLQTNTDLQNGTIIVGGNFTIGGQLPYRMTRNIYLVPFARGFAGMDLGFDGGFYGGIKLGAEFAYHIVKNCYFIVGAGIKPQMYLFTLDSGSPGTVQLATFVHAAITF